MAKVIIGIHGLGNKPPKEILESWWKTSIMEGLEKIGKAVEISHFELVYWADILYEKPLDESIIEKDDPYFLEEKYTPGLADYKPEENLHRQKILDFIEEQLDKLVLNEDLTVNYGGLTDLVIHRYFKDLEAYYAEERLSENDKKCMARKLIRERLASTLKKYDGDDIMLISHSMGSIIAYDVLTFLLPDLDIHTFVTMGSPLGFPVVQGKIAAEWQSKRLVPPKLKTPPGIRKHWYNFADLKDKVSLIYDLSENFEANYRGVVAEDFVVHNDYHNGIDYNPHKSFGYLRSPQFSQLLANFTKTRSPFKRFLEKHFRF